MKFEYVSSLFAQIEVIASRLDMTRLLAELLGKARPHEANIICNLALGQLKPPYLDNQFNIAEKLAARAVAQVLHEDQSSIQKKAKELGDLGLVIPFDAWNASDELTVLEVYKELCAIQEMSGSGSQEEKITALSQLLYKLDPLSARFIIRIILGRLRLGFSDMTIVDALSWMVAGNKSLRAIIEDAYNMCADIGLIAQELKEYGIKKLEHAQVQVGIPILPSAAERLPTAQAIIDKIGPCIAQPKLDGFRLQIHVKRENNKNNVHFFSRNLKDMSPMFPDLTREFERLQVDTLICEGEAIVFDPNTATFSKFQETVKRKRKHGIEEAILDLPLQLFIFDIMYFNGKNCMSLTHEQRRELVVAIFSNGSEIVKAIDEKKIANARQLEDYFHANIAAGLEGLVVKRPDSVYQPGKRNFNWIKLKRMEEGHLEDTLDCVILGYYMGSGKRVHFGIGTFLVGIYNPLEDRFETIAKIGTGLKDEDWKELKKRCDALRVPEQPKNVVCVKELVPDVWVSPEMVCRVRADEITVSPLHSAQRTQTSLGYALRFPRFMGYRTDKSATEATTGQEVVHLYQNQFLTQQE